MEIDYSILEEFNINKEEALTHIDKSAQVKKYVEGICNKEITKSTRTRQVKGLKELLRNIKEWNCATCNIKHYQKTSYNRHLTSVEHKAKLNGLKEAIVCSMTNCRKKFGSPEELEEHLQYSKKCRKSPTNENKSHFIKMKSKWERYKELYSLFTESKETMTDLDKQEYNQMKINDYNGSEEYELVKDELGFLIVKKRETKKEKPRYWKTIKETRTPINLSKDSEKKLSKKEKEILQIDTDLLIRKSKIKQEEIEMEALYRSNLAGDKYLGGPSSDSEYEEIEVSSDEE